MKYFILFLICAVFAGSWYQYDIVGLNQSLHAKQLQEKNLQQQANMLILRQELLEELVVQFSGMKDVLNTWQGQFIKDRDLKKLIVEIKRLGKAHKLEFKIFNPRIAVRDQQYIKQIFDVTMLGNDVQTKQFIEQIAKLPWMVVIPDFTIRQQWQNHFWLTEMELDVYVRNDIDPDRAQHQISTRPAPRVFNDLENS